MSSSASSYQIGRSPGRCAVSGRDLAVGEAYVAAALVDRAGEEGFERVEFSLEAWEEGNRPGALFGYWRAVVPEPNAKPKVFVDDESLMELFDTLEDAEAGSDRAALRFVLTLIMLRKRLLRHVGQRHRENVREMLVRKKGQATESESIAVIDPELGTSEVEAIAGQLEPVLRGGA